MKTIDIKEIRDKMGELHNDMESAFRVVKDTVSRGKLESGLVKVVYILVVILTLLVAHLLGLNHGILI